MGHEGALRAALRALTCESCTLTGALRARAAASCSGRRSSRTGPRGVLRGSTLSAPMPAPCAVCLGRAGAKAETFTLLVPGNSRRPFPSVQLPGADRHRRGRRALRAWEIQGLRPARAVEVLVRLLEPDSLPPDVRLGDCQRALEALAGQQTIPGLKHREDGLYARWLPLLDNQRLERLAAAMPPVCRADPKEAPAPRVLLEDFLEETCDALVREWSSPPEPLKEPSEPGALRASGARSPLGGATRRPRTQPRPLAEQPPPGGRRALAAKRAKLLKQ